MLINSNLIQPNDGPLALASTMRVLIPSPSLFQCASAPAPASTPFCLSIFFSTPASPDDDDNLPGQ